ncbi:MAG: hypothetical protein J0L63_15420 [Anaerolineae bacterium]|nr:hypothetical protein [Anaerolineae bacterium]
MESGNEGVDETALSITDGEGFVVVVVVVADKEGGTPSRSLRSRARQPHKALHAKALGEAKYRGGRRRQDQNFTP